VKSEELLEADVQPTEIPFPEGLRNILIHYPAPRIRRALIFLDECLLAVPDRDYTITWQGLTIPHPIKTLSVVTVMFPIMDERWYYSHADGWGRL